MVRQVDGGAVRGASAGRHRDVLRQDDGTLEKRREINRIAVRRWYARNKERALALKAAWRKNNPEKAKESVRLSALRRRAADPGGARQRVRNIDRKRKYGLTREQFVSLLSHQENSCAICHATSPGKKDWAVDHCHATQKVRGLLCHNCNLMLGHAKDSVTRLRNAAEYLEASQ